MENSREPAAIQLGPADPSSADVAFASIDVHGNPGPLNESVFSALEYEDPPYPDPKQLARGFAVVREGEKRPVVLVVTVGTKHSVQQALHDNLARALKVRRRDLVGRILWIPLMGTGVGGLTNEESLSATLEAFHDSGITAGRTPTAILVATPPDLSSPQVAKLREQAASFAAGAPAPEAVSRSKTAKRSSTKRAGPKSTRPPSGKTGDRKPLKTRPTRADEGPTSGDLAPFYPDHPAERDALSRAAVAEALATIIRTVFEESPDQPASKGEDADRTFMVHHAGPFFWFRQAL